MRCRRSVFVLAILGLACATPRQLVSVETLVRSEVESGLGGEERTRIDRARAFVAAGNVTGAFEELDAVILAFESRTTDADATYVSVANAAEFANFRVEHPSARVVWLDWSYGEAFRMRAFLLASQQRFVEALAALKEGARIAPYDASGNTERGYVLNSLGKPREALASYEEALRLSRRFSSGAGWQATALRGIGVSLIELGELDRAETALRESLEVEPDNALAQNELLYISNLRSRPR